jgi:hypothetical protein
MSQHCSNCSPAEFLAERVDAYKTAVSLLKEAGAEFDTEDILLVAHFLVGEEES